jgi:predicted AlkP superfamily phosphohydrolase/phosphomutase
LKDAPSAAVAGEGVHNVYRAIDRLVGRLRASLPNVSIVLFSMHGMGPNSGDAASFLLLAELLYRRQFGRAYFNRKGEPSMNIGGQVDLPEGETWVNWVSSGFPIDKTGQTKPVKSIFSHALPGFLRRAGKAHTPETSQTRIPGRIPIDWIPATRYRLFWPRMSAFCLPSYYDGRVRVNLKGRERHGVVEPEDYESERERIARMVRDCKDTLTGEAIIKDVEFTPCSHPGDLNETQADVIFVWQGAPTGLQHPRHGTIGPVPFRRTGGHTGTHGFVYLAGTALAEGDYGLRSSFDVVPTLLDLLGIEDHRQLSGVSLLTRNTC